MYYFAYGSNMLTTRLNRRVPSARPVGRAWLGEHRLSFHLRGEDGSGKCNVYGTGARHDIVHGVLFELDGNRLERLHAAEGPAYRFLELEVGHASGPARAAIYYGRDDWIDDRLVPFDWYRAFVVGGAREHGLPDWYIRYLTAVTSRPDPDRDRAAHNAGILGDQPTEPIPEPRLG